MKEVRARPGGLSLPRPMASLAAVAIWWIYGCNKSEVCDWRSGQSAFIFFIFIFGMLVLRRSRSLWTSDIFVLGFITPYIVVHKAGIHSAGGVGVRQHFEIGEVGGARGGPSRHKAGCRLIEAWTTLDRRPGFLSWFATRVAEATLVFAWAPFGYLFRFPRNKTRCPPNPYTSIFRLFVFSYLLCVA